MRTLIIHILLITDMTRHSGFTTLNADLDDELFNKEHAKNRLNFLVKCGIELTNKYCHTFCKKSLDRMIWKRRVEWNIHPHPTITMIVNIRVPSSAQSHSPSRSCKRTSIKWNRNWRNGNKLQLDNCK